MPGAYSDAPGPVDFLAFCILCPGAYSDAPGPVDFFALCICCPGGAVDVAGVCAKADVANSIEAATTRDFLNMRFSSMGHHVNVSRPRMFQIFPGYNENSHMNSCSEAGYPDTVGTSTGSRSPYPGCAPLALAAALLPKTRRTAPSTPAHLSTFAPSVCPVASAAPPAMTATATMPALNLDHIGGERGV